MDTYERRQKILDVLSFRRFETIENLASEFNVTTRTIKNDIKVLGSYAPIITRQGHGGGVFVIDGWYVSKTFLTDPQERLLKNLYFRLDENERKIMESILRTYSVPKKHNLDIKSDNG